MKRICATLAMTAVIASITVGASPLSAAELGIGDPAPPLVATEWVKGKPVDLSKVLGQKIVVVDFWATWCGPCIVSMPHLNELQHKYAKNGVVVVAMTSHDPGNTLKMVQDFVKKQGDKMDFVVAFDKDGKNDKTYMEASGQNGIPTTFVIDKKGRVAWIGHPMFGLDKTIEELVAGTYDIKIAAKAFEIQSRIDLAWGEEDAKAIIKAADELAQLSKGNSSAHWTKFEAYLYLMDDKAKALIAAEQAIAVADKDAGALGGYAMRLMGTGEPSFTKLAAFAAKRAMDLDSTNVDAQTANFQMLASTGKHDDASKAADKALRVLVKDAAGLATFASLLADPEWEGRYIKKAIKAIDGTIGLEPDDASHLFLKLNILAVGAKDYTAAKKVGKDLLAMVKDDESMLNNISWTMLDDEGFKGRFDELALEAAERCHEVSGGENWMFLDTLALAKFVNGARDEAIKYQEKSIELCPNGLAKLELNERLNMFKANKGG